MKGIRWWLAVLFLLAGCGGTEGTPLDVLVESDTDEDTWVAPCPTSLLYDPVAGTYPGTFPDDFYTVEDLASPTGLRVRLDAQMAPWVTGEPSWLSSAYEQLNGFHGFGTTAPILFRFDGPLAEVPAHSVRLVALTAEDLPDVPVEVRTLDSGRLLSVQPRVPLRPGTRYGVVVTAETKDADGGCVGPGDVLRSLLDGSASQPDLARLVPGYGLLLEAASLAPHDVSAAVVFTTQPVGQDSLAVAEDIKTRDYTWSNPPECTDHNEFRRCEGTFTAWDYRGPDGIGAEPSGSYELPVSLWLPLDKGPPWPVIQFGHGAGESRVNGGYLADHLVPLGMAVVAVDAVGFGEHPMATGGDALFNLSTFLGIDLDTGTLDAHALRTNLRQTAYDRLQLTRLVDSDPDLDGDRSGYAGFSLGGITGGELLALGDFDIALLSVGGARMTSILGNGVLYYLLLPQVVPVGSPEDKVAALMALVQGLVDRGDPANHAVHVLHDRLADTGDPPHLLAHMAMADEYISSDSTLYLARSLGLPHLAPVSMEVGLVPVEGGPSVQGNLHEGQVTAALFQFDRVTVGPDKPPVPAGHDSTPVSPEAVHQCTRFFRTWLEDGIPEIVDPYHALGTPPLAPD